MTVNEVLAPWKAVDAALGLSKPIASEARYKASLAFIEECFERFGADEKHPVFALVDLVAARVRDYEDRAHPWPDIGTAATRLAFLMEQHGLRQCDLPEVGPQSVVSAVLSGKRELNLRQLRALAHRFGLPMDALAG